MARAHSSIYWDEDVLILLEKEKARSGNSLSQIANDAIRAELTWRPLLKSYLKVALAENRQEVLRQVRQVTLADHEDLKNTFAEHRQLISTMLKECHADQQRYLEELVGRVLQDAAHGKKNDCAKVAPQKI